MAAVESVEGSVVTTIAVPRIPALRYDTTMLTVTATDPDGLSVSRRRRWCGWRASDYELWEGLIVITDGRMSPSWRESDLLECFRSIGNSRAAAVHTAHWTTWQVKKGSGWVQVPGTYKELEVCPTLTCPTRRTAPTAWWATCHHHPWLAIRKTIGSAAAGNPKT